MSLKDSAMHRSYHFIRKKKKFIPVVEDYLYKRRKGGKRTYHKNYILRKKAHKDPNKIKYNKN
jgi:hypothetical protein